MSKFVAVLLISFSLSLFAQPDAAKFFAKPELGSVVLSPSGEQVAAIKGADTAQTIQVLDVQQNKWKQVFSFTQYPDKSMSLGKVFWLSEETLAAELVTETTGIANLMETKRKFNYLVIDQVNGSKPINVYKINSSGRILTVIASKEGSFLFSKSGLTSRVYQLTSKNLNKFGKRIGKFDKADGGQLIKKNEVVAVDGHVFKWFFDAKGKIHSALYLDPESKKITLSEFTDELEVEKVNEWLDVENLKPRKLKKLKKEIKSMELSSNQGMYLIPIAKAAGEKQYYALDFNNEDLQDVYLVDYLNHSFSKAYSNEAFKIVSVDIDPKSELLKAVRVIKDDGIGVDYLNEDGISQTAISAKELSVRLQYSADEKTYLVYKESFQRAGHYLVENGTKSTLVGSTHSGLNNRFQTEIERNSINVNGLDITYFLSYPRTQNEKLPLIVLPHGGPIGIYDHGYFDNQSQYLNQHGFAVLRINYRGSGGYDKDFINAGKHQFGELILDDIKQVTLHVSKHELIDSNRICIAGGSYGGYAATMLSIKEPDLYKCGVSFAGVQDVYLTLSSTALTEKQFDWTREYLADLDIQQEKINKWSTVYSADQLSVPLLVMHGVKDKVVDIEHAYRLKFVLDKHDKQYEWHIYQDSGHSFSNGDDLADVHERMVAFIKANLSAENSN